MDCSGLLHGLLADPAFAQVATTEGPEGAVLTPDAGLPFLAAAVARRRLVLLVTATTRQAEDLAAAASCLLPAERVAVMPAWETLPHERLSPSSDTVGRRLAVLRRLEHPGDAQAATGPIDLLVAPIRTLLQPIVTGLGELAPVRVHQGDTLEPEDLAAALVAIGYGPTDLVEKRGQFAVRGGIVDVFPPTEEHPLRVEFWGDEVEEIRAFRVVDQRSLEIAPHGVWAPPCRELLLTEAVRARAAALGERHPDLLDITDKLAEGIAVEGMEALAPVLAEGMETLVDVLARAAGRAGREPLVLVAGPELVRTRGHDLVATSNEFLAASWHNAAAGNTTPIDLGAAAYRTVEEVHELARALDVAWWSAGTIGLGEDADVLPVAATTAYRGDGAALAGDLRAALRDGRRVVVVASGVGSATRIAEQLAEADLPARVVPGVTRWPIGAGVVTVTTGRLDHGIDAPGAGLLVITERDIRGQKGTGDVTRLPSRRRNTIDPLQLATGDFVVHEQHGVGRYVEMVRRTVNGATREYLVLEYAPSKRGQPPDRLFVPTDQLDQVTRYVGGEAPSVHRLGGADWQQTKSRARRAVRQIAGELIKLYAARQSAVGFAFGPDTPWQRELEDAFAYQETPDQDSTIAEVKADMQRPIPMDRLVCGDVGYGKTEIAVRAAFKAVQDGKQVAVLVPTTLLVQQHFQTFSDRYEGFPIKVAALSRFQTEKEARAVLEGLADGTIDVVIGTHRLFGAQTRFKDLGLLIVDEEQRFGVEHKEHIKALRTNVDVLTMSATPIPRTLEMAVTGIREMSTIQTPPEERHPVLTSVGPYDDKQIAAAIRRELLRDGQVFFVHNRVESIERVASRLRELVPEARITVAHGQMNEHTLEQVIVDFWEKRFDVLVCTTIVESGLDIPNANTLVVDRADTFGLSQLHQLRGRVGRGRERAYAYFLYRPERPLTETAHDRLTTIAAHTDLGAGMQVAMKDLEIRGAGNLLGGEQSGHIADVGFDLYVRLVGEALAEYRGEAGTELADVKVELPVDAHIPLDYVTGERLRLEAYKRIAAASDEAAIDEVVAELEDRYGKLPEPVRRLMDVARLRVLARSAGVAEVVLQGAYVRFGGVDLPESRRLRLLRLHPGTQVKPVTRTVLVPRPKPATMGAPPVVDAPLVAWAAEVIRAVILEPIGGR
ncbi:MAG: transcription-repair coupling factor [Candidatus Nanopelagicales bacterium]|nr:transcription-repair coupling factor [Candidatus Nanopelagicales bacterium]